MVLNGYRAGFAGGCVNGVGDAGAAFQAIDGIAAARGAGARYRTASLLPAALVRVIAVVLYGDSGVVAAAVLFPFPA